MLSITILGNNSAIPTHDRHPTAQVLNIGEQQILIDCGENTQVQLTRYKIRWSKINYIFISHLHGDHYFGLPGLINSMGLFQRETPLHIYAPATLKPILDLILEAGNTILPFPLHFHAIEHAGELLRTEKFIVKCFPTKHRIPCWGFCFEEVKAPRKLNPEAAIAKGIPAAYYSKLVMGEDYTTKSGEVIKNETVTFPGTAPKSYAYTADTLYDEELIQHIQGVDILYHETTYLKDLSERARSRFHSTTHEAAQIALKANVGKLIIGHFSSKYTELEPFEAEAREVFEQTEIAREGAVFSVK
ncbi:ribonuclease Z [Gynurincola endophyticus]|uniref:ribonuclease Z n=1 Tax=Gynurincola endophyticus TaxID=2479004 RepID=UPI000F8C9A93|nr:ribonuclease Z [Gynurincola endophyticus]